MWSIASLTSAGGTSTSILIRDPSSFSTVVSIERATLEKSDPRSLTLTRRERLAAWYYTGPLGRLVSFLLDFGSLWAAALGQLLRKLTRWPRSR
jgi:hypothetical protein